MNEELAAQAGPAAALQVENAHHAIVAVHIPDLQIVLHESYAHVENTHHANVAIHIPDLQVITHGVICNIVAAC